LPMTQSEAKELILTDLDISQDYRLPYETQAIRGYKQYLGYRAELKNISKSNLHIPVLYRIIDTVRSRMVKTTAGSRPYVDPIIRPSSGMTPELMLANEEKAKIPAALLDMQLEQNRFARLVYDFYTAKLLFPASFLGLCWRYEEKKIKKRQQAEFLGIKFPFAIIKETDEVLFDDNELIYVDFFDAWVDPWGSSSDMSRHGYFIHREWLTREQIEMKMSFYKEQGIGEVFIPTSEEWKSIADIEIPDNRFDRISKIDMPVPDNQGIQNDGKGNSKNRRYALYNRWTGDNLSCIINKSHVCMAEGDNPYWRHRQIPFMMQSYEPLPGEVYGRSLAHFEYFLQEELDTIANQRIDNVSLVINCMWKRRAGSNIEDSQLISRAGGVIDVDNMDDIDQLLFTDVTSSAWPHQQDLIRMMEDTVGSPAIVQGIDSGTSQTATEITSQNSNASIRFDVKIIVDSDEWKRFFGMMDMNNQQLVTDKRLVEMFGQEGISRWREIGPLDIIGFERDYQLGSARVDPAANKELRRQQIWNSIVEGKDKQLNLDFDGLVTEWLKTLDFANPTKYQLTPDQVKAQGEAAAQQQSQQAQQVESAKMQQNQMEFQQDLVKTVIEIIGKLVEKNPMLLGELTNIAGGLNEQSGNVQPGGIGGIVPGMAGGPPSPGLEDIG
jgi:hypothetical protein